MRTPGPRRRLLAITLPAVAALAALAGLVGLTVGARLVAATGLVRTEEGRRILPGFIRLVALGCLGCAALLGSAGALARRPASGGRATDEGRSGARSGLLPVAVAGLLLLSTAALLAFTARRSLTYDEVLQVIHDVSTPWNVGLRPRVFTNHLSGTLLARAGRTLFGGSEAGLRAGSIALTLLGIGAACAAGRRWGRGWLATVGPAAFLGTHGFVLTFAIQTRGYAPLLWCSLFVAVGIAVALEEPERPVGPRFVGLFLAALGLGLSHLFGFLYLGFATVLTHTFVWTGSPLLGAGPRRPSATSPSDLALLTTLSVATASSFLFWSTDLRWLHYQSGSSVDFRETLGSELRFLALGSSAKGWPVPPAVLAGAGLVFGILVWRRLPALRLVGLLAAAPPIGLLLIAPLFRPVFLFGRFFAASLALGAVLLLVGITRALPPVRGLPALVLCAGLALTLPGLLGFASDDSGYREGLREVRRWHAALGGERGRVILLGGREIDEIVGYYLEGVPTMTAPEWPVLVARRDAGIVDVLLTIGDAAPPQWPEDWRSRVRPLPLGPTGVARQSPLGAFLLGPPRGGLR